MASRAFKDSMNVSILADIPLNLDGSGPIILTNCGTSLWAMVQNLFKAFMQRKTCSSGGFPWKNCKIAIANSEQTSSNTWNKNKMRILVIQKRITYVLYTGYCLLNKEHSKLAKSKKVTSLPEIHMHNCYFGHCERFMILTTL